VSHLVDVVLLGQTLHTRDLETFAQPGSSFPASAPYAFGEMGPTLVFPEHGVYADGERTSLTPAAKALIDRMSPTPGLKMMFENARYVASNPKDYLQWAVPTEVRKFIYPLVVSAFKGDPTKVEYARISEEDVARVIEAQQKQGAEGAGAGAGSSEEIKGSSGPVA
jgi:hypothetical protein